MEIILEQAKVIFPGDPLDQKRVNIVIKNGTIEKISSKKISGSKIISSTDLHISPGWVDIGTQCSEPGFEHRDTLISLSSAASAGGYTTLAVFPNTNPVIHSKSEVEFIRQKTKSLTTTILPIGSISKECSGKELSEMIDMHHHGAIAFSDGRKSVQDTGVMLRALMYAKHFNGLLINQPQDESISNLGQMHEGQVSQRLGLKGIPEIAETIMLKRDLELLHYTDGKLVSHLISTEGGSNLVRQAKKSNSNLWATVGYLNLILNDTTLQEFDSVYKQSPPLRSDRHVKALIKSIKDNTLDCICTNHRPLEIEKKDLEFAYATPGAIGLQTSYAAVNTKEILDQEAWVKAVSINPSRILNLPLNGLKEGNKANITLFDPTLRWAFDETSNKSLSKNSPFLNSSFTGKVLGVINNSELVLIA